LHVHVLWLFVVLLGCGLEVEDSLDIAHKTLKVIVAAKKVLEPSHIRPVEKKDEGNIADDSLVHDDDHNGQNLNALGDPLHAELIPVPAAVMGNEVSSSEVKKLVLLGHDSLFLLEGADD